MSNSYKMTWKRNAPNDGNADQNNKNACRNSPNILLVMFPSEN